MKYFLFFPILLFVLSSVVAIPVLPDIPEDPDIPGFAVPVPEDDGEGEGEGGAGGLGGNESESDDDAVEEVLANQTNATQMGGEAPISDSSSQNSAQSTNNPSESSSSNDVQNSPFTPDDYSSFPFIPVAIGLAVIIIALVVFFVVRKRKAYEL